MVCLLHSKPNPIVNTIRGIEEMGMMVEQPSTVMHSVSSGYRGGDPGAEFLSRTGEQLNLQNVWESNLEEEMERLMQASEKYTYFAMVVDSDSP